MRKTPSRPPVPVLIDGFNANLVSTGLDPRGRRWVVRSAPVGALVAVGGRPRGGVRLDMVTPSPDAVTPRCAVFEICGGCQLQEMPLARQREEKHHALATLLAPLGGQDHGILGTDTPTPEDAGYGWRDKLELSCGVDRYFTRDQLNTEVPRVGRWLGMHAAGRFDRIVDAERCELMSEAVNAVLARVRADLQATPWTFWDPNQHTGFFRTVMLREGDPDADGRPTVLVGLTTSPGTDEHDAWLRARAPHWGAAGVLWYESERLSDAPGAPLRAVLHGQAHLMVTLGHVRYRLDPTSFFQANRPAAALLAERVAAWVRPEVPGTGTLLDLYCGTGAWALYCARDFARVVGIEQNPAAIEDARANAIRNGIAPDGFVAGDVEARLPEVLAALPADEALTVIVDPPRSGLHPRALATLLALPARVLIYVACRPSSLARDGEALLAAGWRCTDRVAVDLFPQAGHVEVVTRWERAPTG